MRRPSASSMLGASSRSSRSRRSAGGSRARRRRGCRTRRAGWTLLAAAALVVAVNFGVRGWRWHLMRSRRDRRTGSATRSGSRSSATWATTCCRRAAASCSRSGCSAPRTTARRREVLGTVLVERVLDAGVLAVLFVVLTWAGVEGSSGRRRVPTSWRPALVAAAARPRGLPATAQPRALRALRRADPARRRRRAALHPPGRIPLGAALARHLVHGRASLHADRATSLGIGLAVPRRRSRWSCSASLAPASRRRPGYLGHVRRRDARRPPRGRHRGRRRRQPAAAGALRLLRAGDARRPRSCSLLGYRDVRRRPAPVAERTPAQATATEARAERCHRASSVGSTRRCRPTLDGRAVPARSSSAGTVLRRRAPAIADRSRAARRRRRAAADGARHAARSTCCARAGERRQLPRAGSGASRASRRRHRRGASSWGCAHGSPAARRPTAELGRIPRRGRAAPPTAGRAPRSRSA